MGIGRLLPPAERIAVIGQGYVGLPVTLAFGEQFEHVIGFDIDEARIASLNERIDVTAEADPEKLAATSVRFSSNEGDLRGSNFFVVAVPTPIDLARRPDISMLRSASEIVGRVLSPGSVVVYESTVYPGLTEEICAPILEEHSGLRLGEEFKIAYSPERINPGDKQRTLEKIVKVVAGQDEESLERVARVYEQIIDAGVHRAPSIKVAEAAKVIENTQRDLNIALMNELALIFDLMGISTIEVLEAAGTKWNFLPFHPGLVGGHCIGVDPYYLTSKAEELGYAPEVILAGRRINDGMGEFVARKIVKLLASRGSFEGARVGVLGLAFKENVPDLRNSKVPDVIRELAEYGIEALVHDPLADEAVAQREHGVTLVSQEELHSLDALVLAVPHKEYLDSTPPLYRSRLKPGGVFIDIKSVYRPLDMPPGVRYWSL